MPHLPARRVVAPHRRSRGRPFGTLAFVLPVLLAAGCESVPLEGITPALSDDSPLAGEVSAALAERPEIARFRIKVKSLDEGTVRLSGRVDNDSQRSTAGQAAAAVPGVRSVVNTIYLNE